MWYLVIQCNETQTDGLKKLLNVLPLVTVSHGADRTQRSRCGSVFEQIKMSEESLLFISSHC